MIIEERLHYSKLSPLGYRALLGLEKYLHECGSRKACSI